MCVTHTCAVQVFDRITPKAMRPLQRTQRVFRNVTTSDDPVIRCALAVSACQRHIACVPLQPHNTVSS